MTAKCLISGGSDGARTRDLRRDRPQSSQEFLTGVPTFANPQGAANRLEVGTGYPPPPDPENDSAAGAANTHGAKNIEGIDDRSYARAGGSPQAEKRVVVASWPRNAREQIEVALDQYQDCRTIDLRTWFTSADGSQRPTRSGLSLSIKHLPALADALAKALARARELGLVADGGRE